MKSPFFIQKTSKKQFLCHQMAIFCDRHTFLSNKRLSIQFVFLRKHTLSILSKTKKIMETKNMYEAPVVEIIEVAVEKGYTVSFGEEQEYGITD